MPSLLEHNERMGLPVIDFVHMNAYPFTRCSQGMIETNSLHALLGIEHLITNTSESCFTPRYCCGQFIVSRAAVRRHPRKLYRVGLKIMMERRLCNVMENFWHALFRGEAFYTGLSMYELVDTLDRQTAVVG